MNADELRKITVAAKERLAVVEAEEIQKRLSDYLSRHRPIVDEALTKSAAEGNFSVEIEFLDREFLHSLIRDYSDAGIRVTQSLRNVPRESRYNEYEETVVVITFDWSK